MLKDRPLVLLVLITPQIVQAHLPVLAQLVTSLQPATERCAQYAPLEPPKRLATQSNVLHVLVLMV